MKVGFYAMSLCFFADMLFFDVRSFAILVLFFTGVDYQLSDARCVYFVKSARRVYTGSSCEGLSGILFIGGNLLLVLTLAALACIISTGVIQNARVSAFFPLRPEANFYVNTSSNSVSQDEFDSNGVIVRGSLARLNLIQFVSDFLTGLTTYVAFDMLHDVRLSMKKKTRRILLKGFQAYVHPVFIRSYALDQQENANDNTAEPDNTFHGDSHGVDNSIVLGDGTVVFRNF